MSFISSFEVTKVDRNIFLCIPASAADAAAANPY